jgi:hypothetical protein
MSYLQNGLKSVQFPGECINWIQIKIVQAFTEVTSEYPSGAMLTFIA